MNVLVALVVLTAGSGVSVDKVTVNGEAVAPPPPPPPAAVQHNTAPEAPVAGQLWSVVTPRTVGLNGNMVEAGLGYPGVYGQYSRGIMPTLDLGVRASVNYGVEGLTNIILPELKLQAVLKYRIMDNGKVSLGVNFAPGPLFYFPPYRTTPGFTLPVGITLGIVASSALNIGITFEVPLWIQFGFIGSAVFPILMGGGVEYFVSSSLALWFGLRMGPSIWTNPGASPSGATAVFTFDGRLGVGWRF